MVSRARVLTRLCALAAGVAALVLCASRHAGAAPDPSPDEGRLVVLSYNVHGLPPFITGDDTLGRQRAIAPRLAPFDVVGLQEDWTDEGHALLVGPAPQAVKLRFEAALPDRVYGSGLSLLARGRLVERRATHYSTYHGLLDAANDGMASKGYLAARLEVAPGVEVDVYDTHLDAGGAEGDAAARRAQVADLIEAMTTWSAGRAVVLLADTNLGQGATDRETLARWLEATGLRCACTVAHDGQDACRRIDRILYRGGAGLDLAPVEWGEPPGFVDEAGRPLSDHAPLRAVLRWRRAPV
jgi:endonuclease/exonuclease/phosphatase family metal-dependent hydrolase